MSADTARQIFWVWLSIAVMVFSLMASRSFDRYLENKAGLTPLTSEEIDRILGP